MRAHSCGPPWRGWTTACCLLGLLTAGCFLSGRAVLVLNVGSCLLLGFSPARRLNSLALFSNSFCFSFSSWGKQRRQIRVRPRGELTEHEQRLLGLPGSLCGTEPRHSACLAQFCPGNSSVFLTLVACPSPMAQRGWGTNKERVREKKLAQQLSECSGGFETQEKL